MAKLVTSVSTSAIRKYASITQLATYNQLSKCNPSNNIKTGLFIQKRNYPVHFKLEDIPKPHITKEHGMSILHDPVLNKGTGFPLEERDRLGVRGLVPPTKCDIQMQIDRVMQRYNSMTTDIAKHSYLNALHDRNETLFFRVLMDNIETMAPIIYTPTVGEACLKFGLEFRRARGMYFTENDIGNMHAMVYNWPSEEVDVIVVTDGSRILGLGDLGCHGMPIPVGKLALYTAAGGIHPSRVLPVQIDVGTDNEELRNSKYYLGLPKARLKGEKYYRVIEEFMMAVTKRWPTALVQFEDFNNEHALPLLSRYRNKYLCFNDDIQGTGTVTLAGLLCALRMQKKASSDLCNQRIVCLGGGSAGLGVCNSILDGMVAEGMSRERAKNNFWIVDADGLLGTGRKNLHTSQRHFARTDLTDGTSLLDTVRAAKPTILLGLSGAGGTFTKEIVEDMCLYNERPIIFPLSNPTTKAECTFEDAVQWTNGKLLFASGSPFQPLIYNGQKYVASQGNNMYIFPGVGLGATVSKSKKVTDNMMYAASCALASAVTEAELAENRIYPELSNIRNVSATIAAAVWKQAFLDGVATIAPSPNILEEVFDAMYTPQYSPIVRL